MYLSLQQKQWIIKHFKNTKNDVIIQKLGINHSKLHRFAREQGLTKTKQFQRKCQLAASQKAREANERNNCPPKGYIIPNREANCFKAGQTNLERLGAKKERERIEKLTISLNKMRAAEKRRVLFGLPQKTKLKVIAAPQAKSSYRHTLKKRGYIVERGSNIIYFDGTTIRSAIAERTASERYKLLIKELL